MPPGYAGILHQLDHDHFLPNPFQSTINQSSYNSILTSQNYQEEKKSDVESFHEDNFENNLL
jgi:hypothetical protein